MTATLSGFDLLQAALAPFEGKLWAKGFRRSDVADTDVVKRAVLRVLAKVYGAPAREERIAEHVETVLACFAGRTLVSHEVCDVRQFCAVEFTDAIMHVVGRYLSPTDGVLCACNCAWLPSDGKGEPVDCDGHVFDGICE